MTVHNRKTTVCVKIIVFLRTKEYIMLNETGNIYIFSGWCRPEKEKEEKAENERKDHKYSIGDLPYGGNAADKGRRSRGRNEND